MEILGKWRGETGVGEAVRGQWGVSASNGEKAMVAPDIIIWNK